jgi:hypothetical protein
MFSWLGLHSHVYDIWKLKEHHMNVGLALWEPRLYIFSPPNFYLTGRDEFPSHFFSSLIQTILDYEKKCRLWLSLVCNLP